MQAAWAVSGCEGAVTSRRAKGGKGEKGRCTHVFRAGYECRRGWTEAAGCKGVGDGRWGREVWGGGGRGVRVVAEGYVVNRKVEGGSRRWGGSECQRRARDVRCTLCGQGCRPGGGRGGGEGGAIRQTAREGY